MQRPNILNSRMQSSESTKLLLLLAHLYHHMNKTITRSQDAAAAAHCDSLHYNSEKSRSGWNSTLVLIIMIKIDLKSAYQENINIWCLADELAHLALPKSVYGGWLKHTRIIPFLS